MMFTVGKLQISAFKNIDYLLVQNYTLLRAVLNAAGVVVQFVCAVQAGHGMPHMRQVGDIHSQDYIMNVINHTDLCKHVVPQVMASY